MLKREEMSEVVNKLWYGVYVKVREEVCEENEEKVKCYEEVKRLMDWMVMKWCEKNGYCVCEESEIGFMEYKSEVLENGVEIIGMGSVCWKCGKKYDRFEEE